MPAHRPPFDGRNHISGFNPFVSAYHGFAQLGDERIPDPTVPMPFSIFTIELLESFVQGGDQVLKFAVNGADTRYCLLGKILLAEPGHGCLTGKLRNFIANEAESEAPETKVVNF